MKINQNRKSERTYCSDSPKIHREPFLSEQIANEFQFNQPENIETILIRKLIGIIYEHELEIVYHLMEFYSEDEIKKKFSFIIDDNGCEKFRRYKGEITLSNLQKMLHIREKTFISWVKEGWSINSLHNKTFVNIIGSVKHFPKKPVRNKFWNAIMEYVKHYNYLEFTTELLLVFNENCQKFLNYEKTSKLLNYHNAYLVQNFHYNLSFETCNKYLNLLIAIFLLKEQDLSFSSIHLKSLQRKCYAHVFNTMVNKGKIKKHRKMEFDIVFCSLLFININQRIRDDRKFEQFELVDLSSKISDEGYRYIFSESFRKDYSIKRVCFKLRNLLDEICVFKTPEPVNKKIDQYLKTWDRDYHEYWQLLYPIHVKDLLLLTLGFNIESFRFFEDAQLDIWQLKEENKDVFIYRIDIDRHHLDLDAEYYFPIDFSKSKGFIPKLAPLSHGDHTKITNQVKSGRWDKIKYISKLYKSRLIHLFELILTFDKNTSLQEELKSKVEIIEGQYSYIWDGISAQRILELKTRLIDRKNLSKSQFLIKYYKSFYTLKYKPYFKKCEVKYPSFWLWYNSYYLNEKLTLFDKLKDFYKI